MQFLQKRLEKVGKNSTRKPIKKLGFLDSTDDYYEEESK